MKMTPELELIKASQAEELDAARQRWRDPNMPHEAVEREHEALKAKHRAELKPFKAKPGRKPDPNKAAGRASAYQPKKGHTFTLTENEHKALRLVARKDARTMSAEIALLVKWRIKMLRDNPSLNLDDIIRGGELT